MPGISYRLTDLPFSFRRIVTEVASVLTMVFLVAISLAGGWESFKYSTVLHVALTFVFYFVVRLFLLRVAWYGIPGRIRERIPYDSSQANLPEKDIKSYWGIFRSLAGR